MPTSDAMQALQLPVFRDISDIAAFFAIDPKDEFKIEGGGGCILVEVKKINGSTQLYRYCVTPDGSYDAIDPAKMTAAAKSRLIRSLTKLHMSNKFIMKLLDMPHIRRQQISNSPPQVTNFTLVVNKPKRSRISPK